MDDRRDRRDLLDRRWDVGDGSVIRLSHLLCRSRL